MHLNTVLLSTAIVVIATFTTGYVLANEVQLSDEITAVGLSTTLTCHRGHSVNASAIRPLQWLHYLPHSSTRNVVTSGNNVQPYYENRFKLNVDEQIGRFDLEVVSVARTDAGSYACVEETERIIHHNYHTVNLMVLDGVQSAVIKSPDKSVVKHGDRFVCSADGKPSPRYQWINTLDNSVIDGHQYRVKYCNSQELSQFVLFCVASNVVFGKEYSTTVNVTVNVAPHICSLQAAMNRRPAFAKSFIVYGSTVLSIWSTAAIVVIFVRRSAEKQRIKLRSLNKTRSRSHLDQLSDKSDVCVELLQKNSDSRHIEAAIYNAIVI